MDGSLTLILPAYNEAAGIAETVAEADAALANFAPDYEIIVLDDGSRDATAAIVERMIVSRPNVRLVRHSTNRGYGAALRSGFEAARGERVAFTDADGQFDLADLERLVALTDDAPIAVGYRIDRKDPWSRRFYSWGYNQIVRRLLGTGVRDCDCALKVFRREALAKLLPKSTHFFVNSEMLTRARQQHLAVAEVGVAHRPRRHGASSVSLADIPRTLSVLLPFWWSRVLFRAGEQGSGGAGEKGSKGAAPRPNPIVSYPPCSSAPLLPRSLAPLLLFMVIAAFLCFCRLHSPLLEPEEARYAEIPRQMLAADRWLVPTLHGQDYLDKPPLFYWLVMGSYSLFGVHDWAARLAAGLVAWLTVAVTALWGRRALGPRAGLCAAMILALTPEFIYRGRMLTPNGLLALCTTAALAAGHVARISSRLNRGWWLLSGLALGLGILTKGPVALALVVPPLAVVGWLDRRFAPVGRWWFVFFGAVLAVAAPWFVAVAMRCPEFLGYFFWFHNVVRFAAPFDHAKPIWTYLPQLALGLLPWAILLVPLAIWLRRPLAHRPGALGFALAAFVAGLAFFSLSGSKRPVYLVPLLPPLALALGCTLDRLGPRAAPAWSWLVQHRSAIAWRTAVIGLLAVIVLGGAALAANVSKAERAIAPIVVAGFVLGWLCRRERQANWLSAGTVALGLVALAAHDLLPGYARRFSLKRAAQADPAATAVFCYPQPFDAVSFYRQEPIRVFAADQRGRMMSDLRNAGAALLFVKTTHLNKVLTDLPPALEFQSVVAEAGVTAGRVLPRHASAAAGYARGR
jgi:4-amino-4-deoxy-L-arabinose transferase-like glycosyltransferase